MSPEYVENILKLGLIDARKEQLAAIGHDARYALEDKHYGMDMDFLVEAVRRYEALTVASSSDLSALAQKVCERLK